MRSPTGEKEIGERGWEREEEEAPMASFFPARVSTETRRPTGARSSHRPWTPISVFASDFSSWSAFYTGVGDGDDGEEDSRLVQRAVRVFDGLQPSLLAKVGPG